jgi:hypothetical protein
VTAGRPIASDGAERYLPAMGWVMGDILFWSGLVAIFLVVLALIAHTVDRRWSIPDRVAVPLLWLCILCMAAAAADHLIRHAWLGSIFYAAWAVGMAAASWRRTRTLLLSA